MRRIPISNNNNYRIISVVITHNPPHSIYKLIAQLASTYKIIIIDSSTTTNFNSMRDKLQYTNIILEHENVHYGLGNALNLAIKISKKFEYNFLLIMEDDSFFVDNVDIIAIIDEFKRCYKDKDALYLSKKQYRSEDYFIEIKGYMGTNSGIILSKDLILKILFRAEFFMDQIDIDFQWNIRQLGGKLIQTKYKVIEELPVGRENKNGINTISIFRFYLLTRNTIILFMEQKIKIKQLLYIPGYFLRLLISGQKVHYLFIALFNGIVDALKHNLGITKTLKLFRPDLDSANL